jgi:CheY-like chemotaxis protein
VHADPQQLEQVIFNLVVNASDAMPEGGRLLIRTSLAEPAKIESPDSKQYVLLAVTDTGVGMDALTQQRIFEPFFTTKEKGKGTGLGLSMTQGIVAQSGGFIEVESSPRCGTTFRIFLPSVAQAAEVPAAHARIPSPVGSETILVVEDQEEVLRLLVAALKEYGYSVMAASNANDALAVWQQSAADIHLVLTDIIMPGMRGSELVEKMKSTRPDAKFLFMSGYTDDVVVRHRSNELGIDFLQKPFGPHDLAAKIRAVLEGSAQR